MGNIQRTVAYKKGRACKAGESVIAEPDLDYTFVKSADIQTCPSKILGTSSSCTQKLADARGCQADLKEVQEIH